MQHLVQLVPLLTDSPKYEESWGEVLREGFPDKYPISISTTQESNTERPATTGKFRAFPFL